MQFHGLVLQWIVRVDQKGRKTQNSILDFMNAIEKTYMKFKILPSYHRAVFVLKVVLKVVFLYSKFTYHLNS